MAFRRSERSGCQQRARGRERSRQDSRGHARQLDSRSRCLGNGPRPPLCSRSRSCRPRCVEDTSRDAASDPGARPSGRHCADGGAARGWRSSCRSDRSREPRSRAGQSSPVSEGARPRGGPAPHALFLMGLPGAGKTTVKQRRLHRGGIDIEPDQFKCRHYRFSHDMGEETDDEVHRWSVRRAADAFEDALTSPRKPDLVFDSSGSNARWLGRRIESARQAGYRTELLWVDVPVEIALLRNRDRATFSRHGRFCPEEIIMDKARVLSDSFEELKKEVDVVDRMQNWSERSDEHKVAKEDLYIYPAPRTRAPSLRPGDEGYAEAPAGARSPSPTKGSMRTIRIAPWRRNDEVMRRKSARLAWMDRTYRGDRERFVLEHVLRRRDVYLEPNRFPYHLPPGIEHWTIWSRRSFDHKELCEYIEGWLDARKPHNVVSWNYDDNRGRRTISVWHVHIYFQGADGQPPSIGHCHDRGDSPAKASAHRSPCSV